MAKEYTVKRVCSNCGHRWDQPVLKGVEVAKTIKCPNCECYMGAKIWK